MQDYEKIKELNELREQGIISDKEYEILKNKNSESNEKHIGHFLQTFAILYAVFGFVASLFLADAYIDFSIPVLLAGILITAVSAGLLYAIGGISNDLKEIKEKL